MRKAGGKLAVREESRTPTDKHQMLLAEVTMKMPLHPESLATADNAPEASDDDHGQQLTIDNQQQATGGRRTSN